MATCMLCFTGIEASLMTPVTLSLSYHLPRCGRGAGEAHKDCRTAIAYDSLSSTRI